MKNIVLRSTLIALMLLCLRIIYVKIMKVPFWEQVFFTTSIGFIISQVLVEVIFYKYKVRKYKL